MGIRVQSAIDYLITADWHLDAAPKNEYRFRVIEDVAELHTKHKFHTLVIAGDMVDKKNRHPAAFVNKVVDSLLSLQRSTDAQIVILQGNHDYTDDTCPFFRFLHHFDGFSFLYSGVTRIRNLVLVPHSRNMLSIVRSPQFSQAIKGASFIVTHIPVTGAVTEGGYQIPEGNDDIANVAKLLRKTGLPILSGDIHVPQDVGKNFTYIGAPHHIHFGDTYEKRFLGVTHGGEVISIQSKGLTKHDFTVVSIQEAREVLEQFRGTSGAHVRVTYLLSEGVHNIVTQLSTLPEDMGLSLGEYVYRSQGKPIAGTLARSRHSHSGSYEDDPCAATLPISMQVDSAIESLCTVEGAPDEIKETGLAIAKETRQT